MYNEFKEWYEKLEDNEEKWHEALWEFADQYDLLSDHSEWMAETNPDTYFESLERYIHAKMSGQWNDYMSEVYEREVNPC